ncbi:MAG: amidohydrolase family protein, partial [Blastocatellia bacterium]
LGLADQIGSIEVGKRADLQLVNLDRLHTTPQPDPVSTIVYAAEAGDVETVIIDGQIVMRDGQLLTMNGQEVITEARDEAQQLAQMAPVSRRM